MCMHAISSSLTSNGMRMHGYVVRRAGKAFAADGELRLEGVPSEPRSSIKHSAAGCILVAVFLKLSRADFINNTELFVFSFWLTRIYK